MRIKRFENSIFSSNTYVIDDGHTAVIFDIGDTPSVFDHLEKSGFTPAALFITHTHYDHIYGIREFMSRFPGVHIYTSVFGKEAFKKPNRNFSRYHEDEISIESDSIKPLEDGETVRLSDNIEVTAIATPGHDQSCLTYRIGKILLTGDSYIPGIKVIASFPKSNKTDAAYWYARLQTLSATHTILPGHGETLTPSKTL